ncbi:NAD(P)-dependent alcohol dehydrogenase [Kineosporia babensis]|uniref:NAD(P)-dependent alcohol dehydrogenase n=1 Tax=Kineosporia babensis TaxID=499548 RepID=A0A9X1NK89_9ACTN|nr:NAD(P)-dependent alcohol dehydrogenase [Kineosporia babensis]MCD5314658.1 NAD(P)-dependent alcohol dehydrogenase [Kineosporia babensis]
MKAALRDRYGPPEVVRLTEIPKPAVGPGQIMIKVYATTVNRTDCALRAGKPFLWRLLTGLIRPRLRIAGCEYAGEVEALGPGVSRFSPGDNVFGFNDASFGAHAEYLTVKEKSPIALLPVGFGFEQAVAGTEGAHYAQTMIRGARIEPGQEVLVYGATGAIGSAAVQLLHGQGARVSAVCDTENLDLVRSLGADRLIDRAKGEFETHQGQYHAVLDAVGKSTFGQCRRLLRPGGVYISADVGPYWQNLPLALITPMLRKRHVRFPIPTANSEMAEEFQNLMQQGIFRPVIDRTYSLDEIVEAHRYVDSGRKVGNVVITVRPS